MQIINKRRLAKRTDIYGRLELVELEQGKDRQIVASHVSIFMLTTTSAKVALDRFDRSILPLNGQIIANGITKQTNTYRSVPR